MLHSGVYIAIFILVNLNYFIECGGKRQTVCLKELNAFSVPNTTGNASFDTRPNICSSNTGCCNKSIEDAMKTQITKRIMNFIHGRNERARRQFKDVYDDLKDLFNYVLEETSASTINSLQSQVKAQHSKPHIRTLFDDLRTSVTNKDLHVENSTATFFRNFYPVVYQYVVAKRKLPEEFAECLKDNVDVILPFKDIPQTLTAFLIKKLLPIQQFLRSLQTIGDILDVIDTVQLSDECKSALVKMNYCSLCDGYSDVKPCLEYCTSVMSSCLEPYNEVEADWSSFINKLENFRNLLAKSLDAFAMFTKLNELLSNSLSHASHSKVATKVLKQCGNITDYMGNKIIRLRKPQTDSTRDLGNGDLYLTTDVQNSYQHLPTQNDMNRKLMFLRTNLSDIKDYMKLFNIYVCLGDKLSTPPDEHVSKCWLGDSVGRHVKPGAVKHDNAALKPDNSETIEDKVLLFLKKAIGDIQRIKSRPPKIVASGDGSGSSGDFSGSGVVDPENSGCNDDDEDCTETSGAGSTVSAVLADEPVTDSDGERTTESIETLVPGSGASTSYSSQTLVMGLLLLYIIVSR